LIFLADFLPYVPPAFLQDQSPDEIHARMMNNLPDDIDKSEAQIPWDYTRPTAIELSEYSEYRLNEVIKLIFPQWSYGEYLDNHAQQRGLTRRAANQASGFLTITGIPGTVIPAGFLFATLSENAPSILFESLGRATYDIEGNPVHNNPPMDAVIDATGELTLEIRAAEGGRSGNVAKDTIILMFKPIKGIVSVTNPEATTGGTERETDDVLILRILDVLRYGISYVGNDADYIRWGKSVPGVGAVKVLRLKHGPGTVELVVVDANGQPANSQIVAAVYDYIVSPNDDVKRLAPIGATVTVVSPILVLLNMTVDITLNTGENPDTVKARFIENLGSYYVTTGLGKPVKYIFIHAVLAGTQGVSDFNNLLINGGMSNTSVGEDEFPVTGEVVFNVIET
jgi:uncharacterized phage protein gp47/JayE